MLKNQCFADIAQIVFPWPEDYCSPHNIFPLQHPTNVQFGIKSYLERDLYLDMFGGLPAPNF